MRRFLLSAMACLAFAGALGLTTSARAQGAPVGQVATKPPPSKCDSLTIDHEVSLGWLFPDGDCPYTWYGEIAAGIGGFRKDDSRHEEVSLRFMIENGVLIEIPSAPDWDIGPVLAWSATGDTGGNGVRYEVNALAHARYWFAKDWLTIDMVAGPSMAQDDFRTWRPGFYTRVGPTIAGAFGINVSYDHTFGTPDHRFLVGVDMTYAVAGITACLVAAGMAKSGNARCW